MRNADVAGGSSRRGLARRFPVVIADQVLSSGSNFLFLVLVARHSSAGQFGLVAIAFGVLTVGIAVSRSAIGVPWSTDAPHTLDHGALARRSTWGALCIGLACATFLITLSAFLPVPARQIAAVLALISPIVLLQDFWRYRVTALNRPVLALTSDAAWFSVAASALLLDTTGALGLVPLSAAVWWGAGAFLGCVILVLVGGAATPRIAGSRATLLHDPRRKHLGLDALIGAAVPVVIASGVALVTSAAVTGALRGAGTLMSPVNIMVAAVPMGVLAEASRRQDQAAVLLMKKLSVLMISMVVAWGITLYLLPESVGAALLGPTWGAAHDILPVTTFEYAFIALWTTAVTVLRVRGQTRKALQRRYAYAGMAIVVSCSAATISNDAVFPAGALALAAFVAAGLTWRDVFRQRVPSTAEPLD